MAGVTGQFADRRAARRLLPDGAARLAANQTYREPCCDEYPR